MIAIEAFLVSAQSSFKNVYTLITQEKMTVD